MSESERERGRERRGRGDKKKRGRKRGGVLSLRDSARDLSRRVTRANLSNYLIVEHLVAARGTAMSN